MLAMPKLDVQIMCIFNSFCHSEVYINFMLFIIFFCSLTQRCRDSWPCAALNMITSSQPEKRPSLVFANWYLLLYSSTYSTLQRFVIILLHKIPHCKEASFLIAKFLADPVIWLVNNFTSFILQAKQEKLYRTGQIAYKDREYKYIWSNFKININLVVLYCIIF